MSQSTPEKTLNTDMPTKKTSVVWHYFVKTSLPNKLKCINCKKVCSFNRKSTGNLLRHLKLKHSDLLLSSADASHLHSQDMSKLYSLSVKQEEINNDVDDKSSFKKKSTGNLMHHLKLKHSDLLSSADASHLHSQDMSKVYSQSVKQEEINNDADEITEDKSSEDAVLRVQIKCERHAETSELSPAAEERNIQTVAYYLMEQSEEIDNQILKLIVKEFYPFNLTQNKEFISFVSMLNSNYSLPNYNSLSDDLLLKTYQCKVQHIKSTLKETRYIALTIDRWTSIEDENIITIIAHYLNKDLTLQSSFLDYVSYYKDNSINIPVFLQELVGTWGISDKIVAVVTENDSIMAEAVKECQWEHISCFAYTLNTIIIRSLAKINNVITKVRNIVDYFKRIPNAMQRLQTYQNESHLKLKKDTPSRWNSTFDMITRFLKNKDILKSKLINDLPNELSHNEWFILENAVKLLIVFNTITTEICSEKGISLSKVPYMIRFMTKHVTNVIENMPLPAEIESMGEKLKEELLELSKIFEANDIICQSVLLDPRLKKRGFLENSFSAAYSSLLKNVIALKNERMYGFEQSGKQKNTKQEYFIDVWSEFRETQKTPESDFKPDATAEIDAFLNEAYISMKDNPIAYWANETNQNKFPTLFELVKSRLCVPASSVACKDIFSKEGNALIERRKFLPLKNLKMILFLHHNFNIE